MKFHRSLLPVSHGSLPLLLVSHDDRIYPAENVQLIVLTRKMIALSAKKPRIGLNCTP